MVNSYRTFIAIELPRDLRARIVAHIDRLRRELPDARASWSREDNLHLTLKFLGNVPVADIPKVSATVARATRAVEPFDLTVSDCGVFPPRGRPSVLWIGAGSADVPSASSPLFTLHAAIENECADAGFPREPRPFHPHLTIARLRTTKGARHLAEAHQELSFAPQTLSVSEVVVFRSTLTRDGSKHDVLSRQELLGRN